MELTPHGFLIDVPPDWKKVPVKAPLEYLTSVTESYEDTEQRTGWRGSPKRGITYTIHKAMTSAFRAGLRGMQTNVVVVPLWALPTRVTGTKQLGYLDAKRSDSSDGAPNSFHADLYLGPALAYVEGRGLFTVLAADHVGIKLDGFCEAPCTVYPVTIGRLKAGSGWQPQGVRNAEVVVEVEPL